MTCLSVCGLCQLSDALLAGSTEDWGAILQPQEDQFICVDVLAGLLQLQKNCSRPVLPGDEALPIEHWDKLCIDMSFCLSKCSRVISAWHMDRSRNIFSIGIEEA